MKQRIKQRTSCLVMAIGFIAALALSSCSKEGDIADGNPGSEIRLTSGVQVQSRATTAPDTQIADGEPVAVYVDEAASPATQLYGNNVLTADGNGGLSDGTAMYFPASGKNVDIYAFHTNATLAEAFPTSIEHSVAANQKGGYVSSDLLYAARTDVKRSTSAVDLTFYHLLAKVAVVLKPGTGMTAADLDGAEVTIESTRLKATFTPDKTKDVAVQSNRAAMVATPTSGSGNPTASITIPTATTADFSSVASYGEGIIVPQTVDKDQPFIRVKLANGTTLSYKLDANTPFESGKKHTYQITVNFKELTATATIGDWDKVAAVDDVATMPDPPIGNKTPAQAAVGDFYMNDGSLVGKDENLTDVQKSACIGIVYWVGDPANLTDGDPLLGTEGHHPDCTHGLVVALQDASTNNPLWSSSYEDITNEWLSKQSGNPYGISSLKEQNKMQGYANTAALKGYNEKSDNVKNNLGLKVLPVGIIAEYAKSHPTPASSSDWYWPSVMELKYMCWSQTNSSGVAGKNMLDAQLGKVPGAAFLQSSRYWSSTEYDDNRGAWDVYFSNGAVNYASKGDSLYGVRAVLAF